MDAFFALAGFVILMTGTPGPANMVLMLSGVQQGFIKSLSFWLGTISGFVALNLVMGIGLSILLDEYAPLKIALKFLSAGYMIFLSLKALQASFSGQRNSNQGAVSDKQANDAKGLFRFQSGLIVHPLNPKAWVMLSLAYASYLTAFGNPILVSVLAFAILGGLCNLFWVLCGHLLGRTFQQSAIMVRSMIFINISVVIRGR